jgi:hypothetical protein
MVHEQETYHLRLEQQDVLLFREMPDGTVGMRVLSTREWEDRISRLDLGWRAEETDLVRQVFFEVAEEDATVELAGSRSTR